MQGLGPAVSPTTTGARSLPLPQRPPPSSPSHRSSSRSPDCPSRQPSPRPTSPPARTVGVVASAVSPTAANAPPPRPTSTSSRRLSAAPSPPSAPSAATPPTLSPCPAARPSPRSAERPPSPSTPQPQPRPPPDATAPPAIAVGSTVRFNGLVFNARLRQLRHGRRLLPRRSPRSISLISRAGFDPSQACLPLLNRRESAPRRLPRFFVAHHFCKQSCSPIKTIAPLSLLRDTRSRAIRISSFRSLRRAICSL